MQVLEITTTPMKYEMNIEPAKLEIRQNFVPRADVQTTPSRREVHTQNIQVKLDTYEARKSLGFANVKDLVQSAAARGQEWISQKTRSAVEMGQQMSNIQDGVTISQIIGQKMLEQPSSYTAFLPSTGADISWIPNKMEAEYEPSQLHYNWKDMRNVLNYIPGSVRFDILEYPKVEINYVGSPIYIPKSADPNYEEPAEI